MSDIQDDDEGVPSRGSAPPYDLPVMHWECVRCRFIVPVDVQAILGAPSPTIRVRVEIDAKQRSKHADTVHLYESLTAVLTRWEYWRKVECEEHWEFVQFIPGSRSKHWPLLTAIGRDQTGSFNLVTMHRKNSRWASKMLEGRLGFHRREDGK